MATGMERGEDNYKTWLAFRSQKPKPGDWAPFVKGDKLHREKLAEVLGYANTCPLRQNPRVRKGLTEVEAWLRAEGLLLPLKTGGAPRPGPDIVRKLDDRVTHLEQTNAALRAEVRTLREALKKYESMEKILMETGRMPR